MGLQAIPMRADSGPIGGDDTHEFLVLAETGRLYDTKKGEALPADCEPMPLLSPEELKAFPELLKPYWPLL